MAERKSVLEVKRRGIDDDGPELVPRLDWRRWQTWGGFLALGLALAVGVGVIVDVGVEVGVKVALGTVVFTGVDVAVGVGLGPGVGGGGTVKIQFVLFPLSVPLSTVMVPGLGTAAN